MATKISHKGLADSVAGPKTDVPIWHRCSAHLRTDAVSHWHKGSRCNQGATQGESVLEGRKARQAAVPYWELGGGAPWSLNCVLENLKERSATGSSKRFLSIRVVVVK